MSYSSKLRSHPDKDLNDHLREVCSVALDIHRRNRISFRIIKLNIEAIIRIICLTHDLGKSTNYFQERLDNKEKHDKLLGNHANLSSLFAYLIAEKFIETQKVRKETKKIISFMIFQIVRRHHTNLQDFSDEVPRERNRSFSEKIIREQIASIRLNYGTFKKIIDNITGEVGIEYAANKLLDEVTDIKKFTKKIDGADEIINNTYKTKIIELYFEFSYLYGLLLYSDKMSLTDPSGEFIDNCYPYAHNIFKEYKEKLSNKKSLSKGLIKLNKLRGLAFKEAHDKIMRNIKSHLFILNLPTGLGKTIISLSLAHELINTLNLNSRIIYCLPFISIIDQVSSMLKENILKEEYSKKQLKCINEHHHLVSYKSMDENGASNQKTLIESWSSEIIVTTFEQILYSMINNVNMRNIKMARFSNSIIIFDEIQSFPLEYHNLIAELILTLAKKHNCKIILATATYPLLLEERAVPLVNEKKYFNKLNRTKIINKTKNSMHIQEFVTDLKEIIPLHKSCLVVCNTISEAKDLLKDLLRSTPCEGASIFFLSTQITPLERKKRIRDIKESIDAGKKVVVISTQLIEAGVDLDFEVVIRDFAPFDSIIQAGGRCNRNNEKANLGKIIIYKIKNENGQLYSGKVYSKINLAITDKIIAKKDTIEENQIYPLVKEFYSEIGNKRDTSSRGAIIKNILREWKIEEMTKEFKIIEQLDKRDVFIIMDDISKRQFMEYKENYSKKRFIENNRMRTLMTPYIIQVYHKHIESSLLQKIGEDEDLYYVENLKSNNKTNFQYDDTTNMGMGFESKADIII